MAAPLKNRTSLKFKVMLFFTVLSYILATHNSRLPIESLYCSPHYMVQCTQRLSSNYAKPI